MPTFEGAEKLLEVWFSPSSSPLPCKVSNSIDKPVTPHDEGSDNNKALSAALSHRSDSGRGLRIVPRAVWDEMLAIVRCEIVNVIRNEYVDAYLLSESSMFVFPHKLILKTCGTTTLLDALPRLLSIAHEYCGFQKPWRVFYSRKCFLFPERQLGLHKSWKSEVSFLDGHFGGGSAYKIGKVNGDHWYLYLTDPSNLEWDEVKEGGFVDVGSKISDGMLREHTLSDNEVSSDSSSSPPRSQSFGSHQATLPDSDTESNLSSMLKGYPEQDQTIEILMLKLDPVAMQAFYQRNDEKAATVGGRRVDRETGLDRLYPAAMLDSYLFTPCGYSANALLSGGYFNIHVTPEEACSYASFETNIPVELSHPSAPGSRKAAVQNLIECVTSIFRPAEFCVSFFSEKQRSRVSDSNCLEEEEDEEEDEAEQDVQARLVKSMARVDGYRRTDRILYEFDGYDLVFGHYLKA